MIRKEEPMKTAMIQLSKNKIFLNVLSALSTGRTLSPQPCHLPGRQAVSGRQCWIGGVNVSPGGRIRR